MRSSIISDLLYLSQSIPHSIKSIYSTFNQANLYSIQVIHFPHSIQVNLFQIQSKSSIFHFHFNEIQNNLINANPQKYSQNQCFDTKLCFTVSMVSPCIKFFFIFFLFFLNKNLTEDHREPSMKIDGFKFFWSILYLDELWVCIKQCQMSKLESICSLIIEAQIILTWETLKMIQKYKIFGQ